MNVSELMIAARKRAGMTRRDAAKATGIPYSTLCNYEYGTNEPSAENARLIANAYGISVGELLGIENGPDDAEPISVEEVYDFLVRFGFVEEGEDITDDDVSFLASIFNVLGEWFRNKKTAR